MDANIATIKNHRSLDCSFVAKRVEHLDTVTGMTRGGCNKKDEGEQAEGFSKIEI